MANNAPPEQFVTNPFCGNINPTSATGSRLWKTATEHRATADQIDPKISNAKEFIDMMKGDCQRFGWGSQVNRIEVTQDDGTTRHCSILSDFTELNATIVRQASLSRYLRAQDANRHITAGTFPTPMRSRALDPANRAADRTLFYEQVRANMIGQRIMGSLTAKAKKTLMTRSKDFTWTTAEGQETLDGPTILQIIVEGVKPSTRVGISNLKDKIKVARLAGHDHNVKELCDHLRVVYGEIVEQNGSHEDMVKDAFDAILSGTNEEFNTYITSLKSKWELGKEYTLDELATAAVTKFTNLEAAKSWKAPEKPDSKIAALVTQVNELKRALATVQSDGGEKKPGATSDRRNNIAEWRKKKSHGDSVHRDDKTWYWCPRHKGQDYDGLYVTHKPENHDEHQRRFRKDKSGDTSSTASSDKKLAMKDSLKTALVAKFGCSSGEADKLWSDIVTDQGN